MGYQWNYGAVGLGALLLTACVHERASEAKVEPPSVARPTVESSSSRAPSPSERWIEVAVEPVSAQVSDPQARAHEADDCEGLAILLPDQPSTWQIVALARCLWRTDRIALALSVYDELTIQPSDPAALRERTRAHMAAHFDHGFALSASLDEIRALDGEGLEPGVAQFLEVYVDHDRCASDPWQRWAILEVELERAELRAALGTLLVECAGWASIHDDYQAPRAILASVWPQRGEVALLERGSERLAIARASTVLASLRSPIRHVLRIAAEHRPQAHAVLAETMTLVPRTSPLFGEAVELGLLLAEASESAEASWRVLDFAGPSAAADTHAAKRREAPGFAYLARDDAAERWRSELDASLTVLDALAADLATGVDMSAAPEQLRRCVDNAECSPELAAALGEREWWIADVRYDLRMISEIGQTLEQFAGRDIPATSYAEFWVEFNPHLLPFHSERIAHAMRERIGRRQLGLKLLRSQLDFAARQRP